MVRTTRAASEALGRAILAAAARRFAAEGFAAVALDAVAADAGVTRGAIYHHFGSKEGLFRAVLDDAHAQVGEAVAAAADAETDQWSGFVVGCETFVRACVDDRFRRVLLIDGPAVVGMGVWREADAAGSERHLVKAVDALRTTGVITAGPALVPLLSGALNEAALWVAAAPERAVALNEALTLVRTWLTSIRVH